MTTKAHLKLGITLNKCLLKFPTTLANARKDNYIF